ncbi:MULTISPECIES: hypothetical protein [Nostoc]|nr:MULTISPECIES: hypothetical protein [Nostoc]
MKTPWEGCDRLQNNAAKMAKQIEAWLPLSTTTDHDLALSS